MAKFKECAKVVSQERIGTGIFSLWLQTEQVAGEAKPGQFINLYCQDGSRLLPRPISICEVNKEERQLRIVYRVAGKGTAEFSGYSKGDEVEILGPLGNGFPLDRMEEGKKAFLIGGGIGIPPMLELSRELKGEKQIILGYRDELFLNEELAKNGTVYLATEDGSARNQRKCAGCNLRGGLKCRCDLCLRPHPDASGAESLCRGKRHRVLAFS